jgi:hypothetical protein
MYHKKLKRKGWKLPMKTNFTFYEINDKQLREQETELSLQIKLLEQEIKDGCNMVYYCGDLIKTTVIENQLHIMIELKSKLEKQLYSIRLEKKLRKSMKEKLMESILEDFPVNQLISDVNEWFIESNALLEQLA